MLRRIGIASLGGAGALGLASLLFASSAGAIHEIVITYDVIYAPPGTVVEIEEEPVEPEFQGTVCQIHIEVANNASVHPGTDLIFQSGSQTVVVEDVELVSDGLFIGDEEILVEGPTLTVSVRIGPDGVTSGGLSIGFECEAEPPPTTTEPPSPTTTEPPSPTSTEQPPPTTTEQPPPSVSPQTTFPPTTLPPSAPEPPTAANPTFTG